MCLHFLISLRHSRHKKQKNMHLYIYVCVSCIYNKKNDVFHLVNSVKEGKKGDGGRPKK